MEIIKYILSCIIAFVDVAVGVSVGSRIKELIIGAFIMILLFLFFLATLRFLDKKTNNDYRINILCSIGITILLVCLIFLLIYVLDMIL